MSALTVSDALAAMREAGVFYIRRREGLRPALWRSTERGTFAPVTPAFARLWLCDHLPGYAASPSREQRRLAGAVIAEARGDDHGLASLDDDALQFVSGGSV